MHHLDSPERIAREEIIKDIERPQSLVKYLRLFNTDSGSKIRVMGRHY